MQRTLKHIALSAIAFLLIAAYSASHADTQAICTPTPPNNAVIIGTTSCSIISGKTSVSVVIHPAAVSDDLNAYRIVQNLTDTSKGDLVMVAAGTVPANTVCDASQSIVTKGVTYYRVDRTLVTFSGNNKPPTVWARC